MRCKTADRVVISFLSRCSRKIRSDSTDGKTLYLHGNPICRIADDNELSFNLHDWDTAITRDRINLVLRRTACDAGLFYGGKLVTRSYGDINVPTNGWWTFRDLIAASPMAKHWDFALTRDGVSVVYPTPWFGRVMSGRAVCEDGVVREFHYAPRPMGLYCVLCEGVEVYGQLDTVCYRTGSVIVWFCARGDQPKLVSDHVEQALVTGGMPEWVKPRIMKQATRKRFRQRMTKEAGWPPCA